MSTTVVCDRPCNRTELRKVMDLVERLQTTDDDTDSRVPLDDSCIVVGAIGDRVAVSLFGHLYGEDFGATVVSSSVGSGCALLRDTVCPIFKVDVTVF